MWDPWQIERYGQSVTGTRLGDWVEFSWSDRHNNELAFALSCLLGAHFNNEV